MLNEVGSAQSGSKMVATGSPILALLTVRFRPRSGQSTDQKICIVTDRKRPKAAIRDKRPGELVVVNVSGIKWKIRQKSMVLVCFFVQGHSNNGSTKEKGPHGVGLEPSTNTAKGKIHRRGSEMGSRLFESWWLSD